LAVKPRLKLSHVRLRFTATVLALPRFAGLDIS
jgi:hypothetical protein